MKTGIRVHNEHIENETTVFHIKPCVLPTTTCLTISTNGSQNNYINQESPFNWDRMLVHNTVSNSLICTVHKNNQDVK